MITLAQVKSAAKNAFYDLDSKESMNSLTRLVRAYHKEKYGSIPYDSNPVTIAIGSQIGSAILEVILDHTSNANALRDFIKEIRGINDQELDSLMQEIYISDIGTQMTIFIHMSDFEDARDLVAFEVGVLQAEERKENEMHPKFRP